MKRPQEFTETRWDDPFWQVMRMVVDQTNGPLPDEEGSVLAALGKADTEAAWGLTEYLQRHPNLLPRLAWYSRFRVEAGTRLLAMARTEEQAVADFAALSTDVVKKYGTQSTDHHQSSKVLVQTVAILTETYCRDQGLEVNVDPQKRASVVRNNHIWTSPRRLDGALPSLLNPVGLWEIKEYWGGSGGGSKMSDAIYECHLVGQELRSFEDVGGPRVRHYAILDGSAQWATRKSDLRRAIDLLCCGLLDELLVGSEVLTEWPRIVAELCELVKR